MHLGLILNGKAVADEALRHAVADLRDEGIAVDVRVTWEAGDAARCVEELIAVGATTLVAAGGDGTLGEVASALASMPVTAEARHIYSGRTLVDAFTALGLLVEASPLGLMMGNVYFRVARPGIPARLFTDEARAVDWLKGHAP